jgi:hypothetical protein
MPLGSLSLRMELCSLAVNLVTAEPKTLQRNDRDIPQSLDVAAVIQGTIFTGMPIERPSSRSARP